MADHSRPPSPRRRHLFIRLAPGALVVMAAMVGLPTTDDSAVPHVEMATVDLLDGASAVTVTDAPALPDVGDTADVVEEADVAGEGWTATVDLPIDAQMVAFTWTGAPDGAVRVRSRHDGSWSGWTDLHADPAEVPDPGSGEGGGQSAVGPIWVGDDTDEVEVTVHEGDLGDLEMVALESVEPRQSRWQEQAASAAPLQPAGIIAREQWAATPFRTEADGCQSGPRIASGGVRFIVVHHTVTTNVYGPDDADDLLRGIQAFHTEGRDYCDVAYNFFVDRFGRIWEGRAGGIERAVIGGHAEGFNTASTGIAVLGDYQQATVGAATRDALQRLMVWKAGIHGIDAGATTVVTSLGGTRFPAGQSVEIPTIVGHRDVGSTACPGNNLYPLLASLRRDVQAYVMLSGPGVTGRPESATDAPRLVTLDAWGGVHQAGSHPPVTDGAFWPWWNIARSVLAQPVGGHVLDAYGGLHPYGGAAPVATGVYWPGQDRAKALAAGQGPGSGYVLDAYGGLYAFGPTPGMAPSAGWGFPIARDLATGSGASGGYVLDGYGGLHRFGSAPPATGVTGYWANWDIARAVALRPDGQSGYVLDAFGGLHPFGGAPPLSVSRYTPGRDSARDLVLDADGDGGWMLDNWGYLWSVGDAPAVSPSLTWTNLNLGRSASLSPPSALP